MEPVTYMLGINSTMWYWICSMALKANYSYENNEEVAKERALLQNLKSIAFPLKEYKRLKGQMKEDEQAVESLVIN
jgi:hypothetical protein